MTRLIIQNKKYFQENCKIDTNEKYNNLEVWQPDPGDIEVIDGIESELVSKQGGSGWTPDEMFKTNQGLFLMPLIL